MYFLSASSMPNIGAWAERISHLPTMAARFEGANFAGAHRLLLTPMGAAFAKFKAADNHGSS